MKIYESIVSDSLLQQFLVKGPPTLMNYAANCVGLQETLAVASILWPRIVEDEGLIFIAEFYHPESLFTEHRNEEFKKRAQTEGQKIEREWNSWSLGHMFYGEKEEILENEILLKAFGEVLQFFWSLRLAQLFPEKKFVFEIGEGIAGEEGLQSLSTKNSKG